MGLHRFTLFLPTTLRGGEAQKLGHDGTVLSMVRLAVEAVVPIRSLDPAADVPGPFPYVDDRVVDTRLVASVCESSVEGIVDWVTERAQQVARVESPRRWMVVTLVCLALFTVLRARERITMARG
jgi:hypothetical protein